MKSFGDRTIAIKPDGSPSAWLVAYCGGRERSLGLWMIAGADFPKELRGLEIFFRPLKSWHDVKMNRDNSTGFALPVFEWIESNTNVDFIVAHAKAERKLNIAPVSAFTFKANYSEGLQKRACLDDTITYANIAEPAYPKGAPHILIECEEPPNEPPVILPAQPSLF